MKFRYIPVFALAAMCVSHMVRAEQLLIATGSKTGTYSKELAQLSKFCAPPNGELQITEKNTSGSPENVDLLIGNEVNGAIVQLDSLALRKLKLDLSNIKTLFTLAPEAIHVVVLDGAGSATIVPKTKMGIRYGEDTVRTTYTDVASLAGQPVGAAGGSYDSATLVKLQGGVEWDLQPPFKDNADLKAALESGRIQAAVYTGGFPYQTVADLGPKFRLLSFPDATLARMSSYGTTNIVYGKLANASNAVHVPTTDALFVVQQYKKARMVELLGGLRQCLRDHIEDLQETTGMHPAWKKVNPDEKGRWAYYDLPTAPVPATQAATRPAKGRK